MSSWIDQINIVFNFTFRFIGPAQTTTMHCGCGFSQLGWEGCVRGRPPVNNNLIMIILIWATLHSIIWVLSCHVACILLSKKFEKRLNNSSLFTGRVYCHFSFEQYCIRIVSWSGDSNCLRRMRFKIVFNLLCTDVIFI